MNDLLGPITGDVFTFRIQQAEAIRVLAKRTVADIIEIGQRLIAVQRTCEHGEWLPWIGNEFGWSEDTAERFIAVAKGFGGQIPHRAEFKIDASALYLLAGPTVPESARQAAIDKAEAGDRITKAEAARLVKEAEEKALADAAKVYHEQLDNQVEAQVAKATEELQADNEALVAKIAEIREQAAQLPGIGAAICHALKQRQLTPNQCRALAQIFNRTLSFHNKTYAPMSREEEMKVEENLQIASTVTRALEILAGAPPPEALYATAWPVQRKQHLRAIPAILPWLEAYLAVLEGNDEETAA